MRSAVVAERRAGWGAVTSRRHRAARTRIGAQNDATKVYINALAGNKLLTKEDELRLGRLVQAGIAADQAYNTLPGDRVVTDDWRAATRQAIDDGKRAEQEMTVANLRFAARLANRYSGQWLPYLDLIQEANLGLMHAVKKFDPEKGFRFTTYAAWWIRQQIERALMNNDSIIRVPVHVTKKLNQMNRKLAGVETEGMGLRETAETLEIDVDKLADLRSVQHAKATVSLITDPRNDDFSQHRFGGDNTWVDAPDEALEPMDDYLHQNEHLAPLVAAWLQRMPEPYREVLKLTFGVDGRDEHDIAELAKVLGWSRDAARRAVTTATNLLLDTIREQGYAPGDLIH